MKKILFILVCLVSGFYLSAQENQNVDEAVFGDVVFVKPNPPKAIKGWELVELENGVYALVGEYPGEIIKFQFKGNAVGIEIESTSNSSIIEYSIDASEWEKLDLFKSGKMEEQSSLFFTLGKELKNRKHTLQLRLTDEKNSERTGNKCIIRQFYYNAPD